MRPTILILAPLALTACAASMALQPMHELKQPLRPGEWAWCLTPSGETTAFTSQGGNDHVGATCAAPNRFVFVPACREGEIPADDEYSLRANRRPESEVQAMLAERLRLSRDNSLAGDSYRGRPFCAPAPPS